MLVVAQGFLEFLRSINFRFLTERPIGLDLYQSGAWALLPLALGVSAFTVFLLAIFQAIPRRGHSVPLLLILGALAAGIGLGGTYLRYRAYQKSDGPQPQILLENGALRHEAKPGQNAALLSLPLITGSAVLAGSLAGCLFLLCFGGPRRPAGSAPEKKGGEKKG